MNKKNLIILLVFAGLALFTGLSIQFKQSGVTALDQRSLLSYSSVKLALDELQSLQIASVQSESHLQLKSDSADWRIKERHDYPIDTTRLKDLLQQLNKAKVVELKTAKPEHHDKLQLVDIDVEHSKAKRIELSDGKQSLGILVGKSASSGKGQYVRFVDSDQSYLIDQVLTATSEPKSWLRTNLLNIEYEQVRQVRVASDSDEFEIFREEKLVSSVASQDLETPEPNLAKLVKDAVPPELKGGADDHEERAEKPHEAVGQTLKLSEHFELRALLDNEELQYPSVLDGYVRNLTNLALIDVHLKEEASGHRQTHVIDLSFVDKDESRKTRELILYHNDTTSQYFVTVADQSWLYEITETSYNLVSKSKDQFVNPSDDVE